MASTPRAFNSATDAFTVSASSLNSSPAALVGEMQAYAKLVKKAMDSGINVIQINLKSPNNGDAYVGANWYEIGADAGEELVKACGKDSGKNGKVAIVQGVPTTATSQIAIPGFEDVMKKIDQKFGAPKTTTNGARI